jgi:hypothetical protein
VESDPNDILLLLEAERHTLTPEQRQWHDNFSKRLRGNEIYTIEVAIRAAEIVRTEKGAQQAAALEDLTDNAKRNALERKLKAEVQMLTPEQREHHERWCDDLPGNEPYTTEVAIKAARIIRTERPIYQTSELGSLMNVAKWDAKTREQAESRRQTAHSEQNDIEKQQAREQKEREAKELAAREAAKREPVPSTMQRFNALLEESKAQKAQTNAADIERARQLADNRPNYARHDVLPRGEISEAKAAKLAKMFDKPPSEKYFDSTHDPNNALNYSNGRGGRGGR